MKHHEQQPVTVASDVNDSVVLENLRAIAATNPLAAAYLEIYDHAKSSNKFAGIGRHDGRPSGDPAGPVTSGAVCTDSAVDIACMNAAQGDPARVPCLAHETHTGIGGSARGGVLPLLFVSPEQLADAWDDGYARRNWWFELYTGRDLCAGTTFSDLDAAVDSVQKTTGFQRSGVPPTALAAAAPVLSFPFSSIVLPVCDCAQPMASLKPFDWQCAKCKGVLPIQADAREYLEAL